MQYSKRKSFDNVNTILNVLQFRKPLNSIQDVSVMTQTSKKWRFMLAINYLSSSFIFFRYSLSRKIHFNRFSSLNKIITAGQILKHLYAIVNNKGIV